MRAIGYRVISKHRQKNITHPWLILTVNSLIQFSTRSLFIGSKFSDKIPFRRAIPVSRSRRTHTLASYLSPSLLITSWAGFSFRIGSPIARRSEFSTMGVKPAVLSITLPYRHGRITLNIQGVGVRSDLSSRTCSTGTRDPTHIRECITLIYNRSRLFAIRSSRCIREIIIRQSWETGRGELCSLRLPTSRCTRVSISFPGTLLRKIARTRRWGINENAAANCVRVVEY